MVKEKKKRGPKDLTDYSLRGIRNSINDLWNVVEEINARLGNVELVMEGGPLPTFKNKKNAKKKK